MVKKNHGMVQVFYSTEDLQCNSCYHMKHVGLCDQHDLETIVYNSEWNSG